MNVLFLCTGNSARSIIAEAVLNRVGAGRFQAYSAGSKPVGAVNPHALAMLRDQGYDTGGLRSKSWDEFAPHDAPRMDFVFTVCDSAAEEVCPIWPGQPITARWGLADPAAVTGSDAERRIAFSETLKTLHIWIGIFSTMPIDSLDRMKLGAQLDQIRHTTGEWEIL